MNNTIISVVSYKRPKNLTCDLLIKTSLNWNVYVYYFDEYLKEYIANYGTHVRVINEFDKANLAMKRQLVLDDAINLNYNYCIMLDDDISKITLNKKEVNIDIALHYLYEIMINSNNKYVAMSAAYHEEKNKILENMNICNNSIFNLTKYKESDVRYNYNSKCEDAEFTIDLILKGYLSARIGNLIIKNILQGGTTNNGLSYRFKTNRFIIEGDYLKEKYPDLNIFDYDENHLSIKTQLIKEQYENKIIK